MRLKLLFTIFTILVTACIPMPTPAATDSGIYGQVTVGPTCPVQQINNPCPDKPYQATLTILTTTDHSKVIQFQTDANGNFRVALAPANMSCTLSHRTCCRAAAIRTSPFRHTNLSK